MKRLYILGIVVAFVIIGLVGWRWQYSKAPVERVVIADSVQPMSALLYVAIEKGFFESEGLFVSLDVNPSGKASLAKMLDGKADFAMTADVPLVYAAIAGKPVSVISSIHNTDKDVSIVVRKDRGISKPPDLRGKTIAMTPGSSSAFFLETFLIVNQIPIKDVNIVNLEPPQLVEELIKGSVDAVSTWTINRIKLQKTLGEKVFAIREPGLYIEHWNIVAKQDFIKGRPETIRKLLRAFIKAETFTLQHPDDAIAITAPYLKMEPTTLKALWSDLNFQVGLDQTLLISLENQAKFILRNKPAPPATKFLDYVFPDGLQAVSPDKMTIVH